MSYPDCMHIIFDMLCFDKIYAHSSLLTCMLCVIFRYAYTHHFLNVCTSLLICSFLRNAQQTVMCIHIEDCTEHTCMSKETNAHTSEEYTTYQKRCAYIQKVMCIRRSEDYTHHTCQKRRMRIYLRNTQHICLFRHMCCVQSSDLCVTSSNTGKHISFDMLCIPQVYICAFLLTYMLCVILRDMYIHIILYL